MIFLFGYFMRLQGIASLAHCTDIKGGIRAIISYWDNGHHYDYSHHIHFGEHSSQCFESIPFIPKATNRKEEGRKGACGRWNVFSLFRIYSPDVKNRKIPFHGFPLDFKCNFWFLLFMILLHSHIQFSEVNKHSVRQVWLEYSQWNFIT